jgi:copper chaperone
MKIKLKINGMHCKSCEMLIADALEDNNVKSNINSETGIAEITFDESKINLEKIKKIIEKEGFTIK